MRQLRKSEAIDEASMIKRRRIDIQVIDLPSGFNRVAKVRRKEPRN